MTFPREGFPLGVVKKYKEDAPGSSDIPPGGLAAKRERSPPRGGDRAIDGILVRVWIYPPSEFNFHATPMNRVEWSECTSCSAARCRVNLATACPEFIRPGVYPTHVRRRRRCSMHAASIPSLLSEIVSFPWSATKYLLPASHDEGPLNVRPLLDQRSIYCSQNLPSVLHSPSVGLCPLPSVPHFLKPIVSVKME